jgi:hypothetical protein
MSTGEPTAFHQHSAVEHDARLAQPVDDCELVRDQQVRQSVFLAQPLDELQAVAAAHVGLPG